MRVFFDTNVYVAEAILGGAAGRMVEATARIRWRILCSEYVLDEAQRVLVEKLQFSPRLGQLSRARIRRRAQLVVTPASKHQVLGDPADPPILAAAVSGGVDLLVTNDAHLLNLYPYQGLRTVSMADYRQLLVDGGHLPHAE